MLGQPRLSPYGVMVIAQHRQRLNSYLGPTVPLTLENNYSMRNMECSLDNPLKMSLIPMQTTSMTKILQRFKLENSIEVALVAGHAASVQRNLTLLDQTHYALWAEHDPPLSAPISFGPGGWQC